MLELLEILVNTFVKESGRMIDFIETDIYLYRIIVKFDLDSTEIKIKISET